MQHLLKLKLLIAAVFGVILAFGGIAAMRPEHRHDQPPLLPPTREFEKAVAGVGLIEPSTENIVIGTPIGGIVEEVFVKVGEQVQVGAPLFALDVRQFKAELGVREAAKAAAAARVETNRELLADFADQLERVRKLDSRDVVSINEKKRIEFSHRAAIARLRESEAELASADAQVSAITVEIERSTVVAPVDATVLQVKIRRGEFAAAGATGSPLLVMGQMQPLHVRVDVDENDAARVRPAARAYARPRGLAHERIPLKFVRFEPYIIPKKSLTGDSTERVDVRVLQCLYEVASRDLPLFIGQQVDVFIEETSTIAQQ